jgi:glycosyltransferase involved in cell wall biosynthesis
VTLSKYKITKPYILLTNRHFPQKRFEFMIAGLPYLIQKNINVQLVITGNSTAYTNFLKKLVYDLGLKNYVYFTGLLSETDLVKAYKNSAVYVYTAPEEDFGMGVIEAMGYGVPVVAWASGGPATTIINNKTGILVRNKSFTGFVSAIEKLLINKKLNQKMGESACLLVNNKYSYDRHIKHLSKTLNSAYRLYYDKK